MNDVNASHMMCEPKSCAGWNQAASSTAVASRRRRARTTGRARNSRSPARRHPPAGATRNTTGTPQDVQPYGLRHTAHILSTRPGATLADHDATVRKTRAEATEKATDKPSATDLTHGH
ncbi:hypothetical protein [Streptomyces sp. SCL15-4]|uniref:hypothetical protein n=1 Tax=Streptomyces sp. SCL15-4 TaxID=2967221 RepID=UPI002966D3AA|nr:hypothetical protein [Streptomyces sp. SCL15-4]